MAPEVINGRYDHKADVWSVGIVALELAEKDPPYIYDDHLIAMEKISNGPSPKLKNSKK
jgi:Protein kinase domain.